MFKSFGVPELLIILLIVLVIFGAGRLPEIGKGLGSAIRGFKDAATGKDDEKKHGEGQIASAASPASEPASAKATETKKPS